MGTHSPIVECHVRHKVGGEVIGEYLVTTAPAPPTPLVNKDISYVSSGWSAYCGAHTLPSVQSFQNAPLDFNFEGELDKLGGQAKGARSRVCLFAL